jgi:hypothetical protein
VKTPFLGSGCYQESNQQFRCRETTDHFFLDFVFGCFNDGFSAFLCGYE